MLTVNAASGFGTGVSIVPNTNVKLLLHCEGADEGTSFTDSSSFGHTMTARGNAKTDSAQSKFGSTSMFLDGTGDAIDTPDASLWTIGTQDFSFETWIRWSSDAGGTDWLWAKWNDGDGAWGAAVSQANTYFYIYNVAGGINHTNWDPDADTWYHVEVSRTSDYVRLFVDGTQVGPTRSFADDLTDNTAVVSIGSKSDGSQAEAVIGWMDEVRILIGEGGHTSNFTPRTAPYNGSEVGNY